VEEGIQMLYQAFRDAGGLGKLMLSASSTRVKHLQSLAEICSNFFLLKFQLLSLCFGARDFFHSR